MTARKRKPTVYRHYGSRAEIGPRGAWAVGDRVRVPARPPKMGDDGMPSFDGEVWRVDPDGVALVRSLPEEGDDGRA